MTLRGICCVKGSPTLHEDFFRLVVMLRKLSAVSTGLFWYDGKNSSVERPASGFQSLHTQRQPRAGSRLAEAGWSLAAARTFGAAFEVSPIPWSTGSRESKPCGVA